MLLEVEKIKLLWFNTDMATLLFVINKTFFAKVTDEFAALLGLILTVSHMGINFSPF
jgi:hypothetical protein